MITSPIYRTRSYKPWKAGVAWWCQCRQTPTLVSRVLPKPYTLITLVHCSVRYGTSTTTVLRKTFSTTPSTGLALKLYQKNGPQPVVVVISENHPYVLAILFATWKLDGVFALTKSWIQVIQHHAYLCIGTFDWTSPLEISKKVKLSPIFLFNYSVLTSNPNSTSTLPHRRNHTLQQGATSPHQHEY